MQVKIDQLTKEIQENGGTITQKNDPEMEKKLKERIREIENQKKEIDDFNKQVKSLEGIYSL
jgi:polyhydroxyalkanoate synthesis regulator phasin